MLYNWFQHISFAYPWFFTGLLLLPLMIWWYISKRKQGEAGFTISSTAALQRGGSWRSSFRHLLLVFRLLAVACIVIALARPQRRFDEELKDGQGIDIVICMDVSGSMLAMDLLPDRLEAAKNVAADFVSQRATDRIGVVIFSGECFTLVPLTTDKQVLRSQILSIQRGLLEDGTAIGEGLGISIARLRSSTARSKIVILLTDGEDQGGRISPLEAKLMAKQYGVRVYTIGVGTEGFAPFPVERNGKVTTQMQQVNLDEPLLRAIASETGGLYFRARDTESLKAIYGEIDKLEKSKIEVTNLKRYSEKFHPFALAAAALVLLELLLRYTLFRKFP